MIATRNSHGLVFECPSPSIWFLVNQPVQLAYDGRQWWLSFLDRDNIRREGCYARRDAAIAVLAMSFNKEQRL